MASELNFFDTYVLMAITEEIAAKMANGATYIT